MESRGQSRRVECCHHFLRSITWLPSSVNFSVEETNIDPRRELLAGQRTAALNALRGHLAEIGVVAPQGVQHAYDLKRLAGDGFDENGEVVVPDCVRVALRPLISQIDALDEAIGALDREIDASVKRTRRPSG